MINKILTYSFFILILSLTLRYLSSDSTYFLCKAFSSEILPEEYVLVPSPSPSPFSESEDDICIVDDFLNDRLAEEILNSDLSNEEIFPF
jgi:hypothetical protein